MKIFKTKNNDIINPFDSIFPIMTGNIKTKEFVFIGTGFFINSNGGFITAKHVMFPNNDNKPINPFFAIQTVNGNKHYIRYIEQFVPHGNADIAIGMLKSDTYQGDTPIKLPINTSFLKLSKVQPNIGQSVSTFAYPKSGIYREDESQVGIFNGSWQEGKIEEYLPDGRDKIFLPSECYRTSLLIEGGASGGPVILNGKVIGINSTGYDLIDDSSPISYITPISKILDLQVIVGPGQKETVSNLIKDGKIIIE
jgi:hypothetical protein